MRCVNTQGLRECAAELGRLTDLADYIDDRIDGVQHAVTFKTLEAYREAFNEALNDEAAEKIMPLLKARKFEEAGKALYEAITGYWHDTAEAILEEVYEND